MTTFREVLDYVGTQATAEEVRALFDAGNARIKHVRAIETAEKAATLKKGDTVTTSGLKPAYLNGLKGTIESIDRASRGKVTATLKLDGPSSFAAARYSQPDGVMSGVPVGCLTVSE